MSVRDEIKRDVATLIVAEAAMSLGEEERAAFLNPSRPRALLLWKKVHRLRGFPIDEKPEQPFDMETLAVNLGFAKRRLKDGSLGSRWKTYLG